MAEVGFGSLISLLGSGVVLGLAAGFSPGPLLTLVISQTIRHGFKEGVKVAVAPCITDLPIVLFSLFVLTRITAYRSVLGVVSIFGALFVVMLAYDCFRSRRISGDPLAKAAHSLSKGAIVNALSPYPYLFWLTVGAPMMIKAWRVEAAAALAFIAGFYACLIGAKLLVAFLSSKSMGLLKGKGYGYLMRALGLLLLAFAFHLLKEGWSLLALKTTG